LENVESEKDWENDSEEGNNNPSDGGREPKNNFNPAMKNIHLSPIVRISEMALEMGPSFRERTGKDFVYFQRGEVDFPTPEYIKDAAKRALDENRTKYPKSGGEPGFKDAILRKLLDFNKAEDLTRENVVCTYGGMEALQLSFKLFEGGKAATFAPYWSPISENFVPFLQMDLTEIPLKDDFSVDYDQLDEVLKDVNIFYFNTPNNPTGKVFSEEEVKKIAELCYQNDTYLVSDEPYERIVYDGKEHFSAASLDYDNIISAFSFSKTYSMTGWRMGYLVARDPKVAGMLKLGNYSCTAGVVQFLQYAGIEALDNHEEGEKAIERMVYEYKARRDILCSKLASVDGVRFEKPEGAFYLFPNFTELIPEDLQGKARDEYVFDRLMENGVATVYGYCFGKNYGDNIRISFSTTPIVTIEDGVERIREAFK
jgi:aspartate aminotransferase